MRIRTNAECLGTPTLEVRISREFGRDVIHPLGRLDAGNRNLLFCHCLAPGKQHVVIDMTYVSEIDHHGLAGILAARHVLESERGSLSIRHASGQPARFLAHGSDTAIGSVTSSDDSVSLTGAGAGHSRERSGRTSWL